MVSEFDALDPDAGLPACTAPVGQKPPLQKMEQKLALFAAAHALDFLGDIEDVGVLQPARAQERRLLARLGVDVSLVEVAHGHTVHYKGVTHRTLENRSGDAQSSIYERTSPL
jgi:hypothetical protein